MERRNAENGAAPETAALWEGVEDWALREVAVEIEALLEAARDTALARRSDGSGMRFSFAECAESVGLPVAEVRRAAAGAEVDARGRGRLTFAEANRIREAVGRRPSRGSARPARIAVQTFKGGAGKTTLAVHFAQFLARQGYRVLVVDCDAQATATSTFGFVPDVEFGAEHTVVPLVTGEEASLAYAVRPTRMEGVDIVPGCLGLQMADIELCRLADGATGMREMYGAVARGLDAVEDAYDVVVMDSAPGLSMLSVSVALAATGLVVPVSPTAYDLLSTAQYIRNVAEALAAVGGGTYDFVRLVPSRVDRARRAQMDMLDVMRVRLGGFVLSSAMLSANAVARRAEAGETLLSAPGRPDGRVLGWLYEVMGELERAVVRSWERCDAGA